MERRQYGRRVGPANVAAFQIPIDRLQKAGFEAGKVTLKTCRAGVVRERSGGTCAITVLSESARRSRALRASIAGRNTML
jgi:hypothetical protein